jgi:alginate O-acetyltransferase complex protein AlgI
VIWGAYHGCFLVIERLFLGKWLAKIGKAAVVYSFPVVMIGWVFFRMEHFHASISFLSRMFSWHADAGAWAADRELYFILVVASFFSFFTLPAFGLRIQQKVFNSEYSLSRHFVMAFAALLLMILSAAYITTSTFNPFIYFRF